MTGPEHYREAERLLRTAAGLNGERPSMAAEYIAAAQVHATLAAAAGAALAPFATKQDGREWSLVARPRRGGLTDGRRRPLPR